MVNYFYFILGLVLLSLGGDLLVRGASRLAILLKISPLVVGLTVVAYGTGAPELSVSLVSAFNNNVEIALGNVVGSNICNIFLVLGVSALLMPLVVEKQIIYFDVPLMIGASLLLMMLGLDGKLGRFDGAILVSGIIVYTVFIIRQSRRQSQKTQQEYAEEIEAPQIKSKKPTLLSVAQILLGLVLLVLGSRWLVQAAIIFAKNLGLSELVVGLTVVAVGTSLPEITTSVVAAARGKGDIAVGNVVGSNIYNIFAVLGLCALLAKGGVPVSTAAMGFDIPIMIGAALACLPIFFTGHKISRWEGALFLAYYAAYTVFLVLKSSQHDLLPLFSGWMLSFVLPLTVVTLLVFFFRSLSQKNSA